ncbi:MAG: hypothetical protein CMN76_02560 [Spirochaetaceae bacterium]|nr:hypothetical protein [Spirochaetaceae bacterium]|tara:strand:- start:24359 stop:25660 length:1302 start_codon:yes stop_codon:yes gene_type:complete
MKSLYRFPSIRRTHSISQKADARAGAGGLSGPRGGNRIRVIPETVLFVFFLLLAVFSFVALPYCSGAGQKPGDTPEGYNEELPLSESVLTELDEDPIWNRTARLIAGLEGGDAAHRNTMDRLWSRIETQNINPIQSWIADKDYLRKSDRPVFYPLSGADFINAHTFFPEAPFYVLVATEPPGRPSEVRSMENRSTARGLASVRAVITNISGENYFQSRKMSQTMNNPELSGVLPVLLVWLARKDQQVLSVQAVSIAADGMIGTGSGVHPGLRIRFRRNTDGKANPEAPVQTLYYFKIFLGPGSVNPAGGKPESRALGNLENVNTIMKAAVYLLHNQKYAPLAKSILERSQLILQDDSGVPFRMFDDSWAVDLYGNYTRPVALKGMLDPYDHLRQPALAQEYSKRSKGELPFPYSYGILRSGMEESMLMLARKK